MLDNYAAVAQMVERNPEEVGVVVSKSTGGTQNDVGKRAEKHELTGCRVGFDSLYNTRHHFY